MAIFKDDSATIRPRAHSNTKFYDGEHVLAYYGHHIYETKVLKSEIRKNEWNYFVHYLGWSKIWDEWVGVERLVKITDENIRKQQAADKKQGVEPESGRSNETKSNLSNDSKVGKDTDNVKTNGAQGKKRKRESCALQEGGSRLEKTLRLYKESLGIDMGIRILCDSSYIRYISSLDSDDKQKLYDNIRKNLGVKDLWICTTSCVYADMLHGGEGDEVLKYAINIPFECVNHWNPLAVQACIEDVFKKAVLQPFALASLDGDFCRQMREITAVPIIGDEQGRLSFWHLKKSDKKG